MQCTRRLRAAVVGRFAAGRPLGKRRDGRFAFYRPHRTPLPFQSERSWHPVHCVAGERCP
jgi:hypothetical protein